MSKNKVFLFFLFCAIGLSTYILCGDHMYAYGITGSNKTIGSVNFNEIQTKYHKFKTLNDEISKNEIIKYNNKNKRMSQKLQQELNQIRSDANAKQNAVMNNRDMSADEYNKLAQDLLKLKDSYEKKTIKYNECMEKLKEDQYKEIIKRTEYIMSDVYRIVKKYATKNNLVIVFNANELLYTNPDDVINLTYDVLKELNTLR